MYRHLAILAALAWTAGTTSGCFNRAEQPEAVTQETRIQLPEQQLQGTISKIDDDSLELNVANRDIELQATQQQLQGLTEGQSIEVVAKPALQASELELLAGDAEDNEVYGRVVGVDATQIALQTFQGERILIGLENANQKVRPGQYIRVGLDESPSETKDYRVIEIRTM